MAGHMVLKVGKTAVIALFLVVPAYAQRSITYRSQQLDCAWMVDEIERMVDEQSWTMEEPSLLYKTVSVLKVVLDIVGGHDEEAFLATVPKRHPFSFSYKPSDILEAMRYKGCAEEYGRGNSFIRSGTLEADKVYKPKSRLNR